MKQGIKWQVTSLDVSRRLKELGVRQESVFAWVLTENKKSGEIEHNICYEWDVFPPYVVECISAFTVSELGETLPYRVHRKTWSSQLHPNSGWECSYENSIVKTAETEANARGKMLIYLLENNLVKAEDL